MSDMLHIVDATPHSYKLAGALALAGILAALLIAGLMPAPPKAEVAKPAEPVIAKGVRIVPIYRKIEERAPMEPAPAAVTTVEKAPPLRAVPKADTPLLPVQEARAKPEPEPELELPTRRHYGSGRHFAEADICARHGMHKVLTHNGKGWRCR
jgi:hypothetical protein